MATITLVQATGHMADHIHLMTAQPMNVDVTDLTGGGVQFTCSNSLAALRGAKSVDVTYDAAVGSHHESIQVSTVMS